MKKLDYNNMYMEEVLRGNYNNMYLEEVLWDDYDKMFLVEGFVCGVIKIIFFIFLFVF